MLKITLTLAVTGVMFVMTGIQDASAQVVTTYYAPAPAVSLVPVRRGLLGLRTGYAPVVTGVVPVPVTSYYAPAPTYAPAPGYAAMAEPAWSQGVTSYYAPGAPLPVTTVPVQQIAPVTMYYAPAPVPVTTYYGGYYAPPVYYRR